jgi:hypothetical protein
MLVKLVKEWSRSGQRVVKEWSKSSQGVVKEWSKSSQGVVKEWSRSGERVIAFPRVLKEWSKGGQIVDACCIAVATEMLKLSGRSSRAPSLRTQRMVKRWSKSRQKLSKK